MEQVKDFFRKFQKDIASTSSMLIVGGGAIGIELVGELTENVSSSVSIEPIRFIPYLFRLIIR
jgi:NADH dehydrogenase FAD-containing subunit